MKLKEIFSKPEELQAENNSENAESLAENVIAELLSMQEKHLLKRDAEEYISDEAFSELVLEFPVKAAVRIYDAELSAKEAEEKGRKATIDEIYKRKSMPKPMRVAQTTEPTRDFGKMSKEDFEKFKKSLKSRR